MWLISLPIFMLAVGALAKPEPGQLRVPKVYNAVITSNQNLAPSRAYPVIQPVVHRTAIGYVPPPFYYGPIPPGYGGPGVLPLGPGVYGPRPENPPPQPETPPARPEDVESVEATDGASTKKISRPKDTTNGRKDTEDSGRELESEEASDEATPSEKSGKKGKNDRVPFSFYPNYQSLYYDPYFYPYNAYPSHLAAPGTYYVDYPQPPGVLGPLPQIPPPGAYPGPGGRPQGTPQDTDKESSRPREKEKIQATVINDKIPDVPAPPIPTALRKKAS